MVMYKNIPNYMKFLKQIAVFFLTTKFIYIACSLPFHSTSSVFSLAYFRVRVQNLNICMLSDCHLILFHLLILSLYSSYIVNEPQAIFPTVMLLLTSQRKLNQQKKHLKHNISPQFSLKYIVLRYEILFPSVNS